MVVSQHDEDVLTASVSMMRFDCVGLLGTTLRGECARYRHVG